jgi:hypothetical protein
MTQQDQADPFERLTGKTSKTKTPQKRRFKLKQFDAIKVSTSPNYLVKGILPRTGLVVVWGPPKCGKSFWSSTSSCTSPSVGAIAAAVSSKAASSTSPSKGDFLGRLSFDCLAVLAASGARHGKFGNSDF